MTVATKTRLVGVVGESAPRSDAPPKTQGTFAYASDLARPGMLHGATVRSPHPRARIMRVDTGVARAMPGVFAVLTSADLPTREKFGLMKLDQPPLATDVVRYVGEPVAIVAAEDAERARLAAKAIVVEYAPLEAITDPVRALQPDAPSLHDGGNVIEDVRVAHGDVDAGADVVVAGEYEIGMQDQAPLGPEAGLAIPDPDGGVTLHIATQWLHEDLRQIAACLGLPESKVRLVLAGVGGAFGAREDVTLQIHLCLLALATKKPVRMVYGREESFYGHVHRHPARLWYAHGARRDGTLVFVRASIVLDGGGYASASPAVVANAACFGAGPYRVPNAVIHAVGAYTNNPPTGAMRGFGAVQSCFAYEAQMDKLAAALRMDPVELRARNALADGDQIVTSQTVEGSEPVANVIRRCAALPAPAAAEHDDPVAIVAAEDAERARLAAKAIVVEYAPLEAITDPVRALQPDAPSLHDGGNVIEDVRVVHGDVVAGADVVVEGEYEIGMQDQAPLGPEAGLAIPDPDGGVTLHIATQWLHEDLRQIAACLGLPESKVRLVLAA
ncbi:MAG TPA: molybdopterin cofactor-binding domain-containing protein, partial [Candidatus Acidoferrales bacterium]|nr:molybdopterin cofactor-binding domain-containing protein [Candidatus Acidoferrales bacterium]